MATEGSCVLLRVGSWGRIVVVKLVMGRSGEERVLKGVVVVVLGVRYLM